MITNPMAPNRAALETWARGLKSPSEVSRADKVAIAAQLNVTLDQVDATLAAILKTRTTGYEYGPPQVKDVSGGQPTEVARVQPKSVGWAAELPLAQTPVTLPSVDVLQARLATRFEDYTIEKTFGGVLDAIERLHEDGKSTMPLGTLTALVRQGSSDERAGLAGSAAEPLVADTQLSPALLAMFTSDAALLEKVSLAANPVAPPPLSDAQLTAGLVSAEQATQLISDIAKQAPHDASRLVPRLVDAFLLSGRDESGREAIGSFGPSAVKPLIALLDADPKVARTAAELLGTLGRLAAPAVPKLLERLEATEPSNREGALTRLNEVGGDLVGAAPGGVAALISSLPAAAAATHGKPRNDYANNWLMNPIIGMAESMGREGAPLIAALKAAKSEIADSSEFLRRNIDVVAERWSQRTGLPA